MWHVLSSMSSKKVAWLATTTLKFLISNVWLMSTLWQVLSIMKHGQVLKLASQLFLHQRLSDLHQTVWKSLKWQRFLWNLLKSWKWLLTSRMLRKLQSLMLTVQHVRNLKWLTCLVNQAKWLNTLQSNVSSTIATVVIPFLQMASQTVWSLMAIHMLTKTSWLPFVMVPFK